MITALLAYVGSQLAAAQPAPNSGVFTSQDFPKFISDRGTAHYAVATQTVIDANGKMIGCRTEQPSSEPRLGPYVCAIILKRARFEGPAHWTDGTPVLSIFRMETTFAFDQRRTAPSGDLEIAVEKLPAGAGRYVEVNMLFGVDENGVITDCQENLPASARSSSVDPALVTIACNESRQRWKPVNLLDAAGRPAKSVQNATAIITQVAGSRR